MEVSKILNFNFFFLLSRREEGFTLLELILVIFLITLIIGLSTVLFVNALPSSKLNSVARDMSAAIRHARSLAAINGGRQTFTLNLDERTYGIEGRREKKLPDEVTVKIEDPFYGEVAQGTRRFVFQALGVSETGTIVLSTKKRSVRIEMDPVVGAVTIK
jgi:general secretion pathway protein H